MADIVYTVTQDSPEAILGFEQYSEEDKNLINSFKINSTFDVNKHFSELHILSLSDDLLESIYDYTNYTLLGNAQSAGQEGASVLTVNPIQDSKAFGYANGGIKLLYHFLDDLYTQDRSKVDFYIEEISADRTELLLSTLALTPEVVTSITSDIKTTLQSQSYFTGFRLNFKSNDLIIATNIDTVNTSAGKVVAVKLYEPLPATYRVKSILNVVNIVSNSTAYEVDSQIIVPPTVSPTLRSPNFNIEVTDDSIIPTQYYNYNDLFSYPVTNANSQIYSTVNEKGINISVDYSTFNDFIHFSSAQERLLNFKYKLDLVASYSQSIASGSSATTGLQGISGSRDYYENQITGILNNFDHYERFLYYESGSSSWPKSNKTKPYVNKPSSNSESITWYTNQIANAISYDNTNYSSLAYSIPTFLRDDANNENYLTFVYMVGQHFDNLWLYAKAVTDKYDADNRMDYGISKDLVAEALENFGVKLYTSNKSVEDLFTTFIGQAYQSGSEKINHYMTGSLTGSNTAIQPTSYGDYQKQVQKRIYHNLPLLLKSKGTERGLRALINCLGIPGDILDIKLYGGRNINETPFFGDYQFYTSSIDKVRLDNTGSIVSGSTLSNFVSIVKRDNKYTDDLHAIEVGFSPTDNIDQYIIRQLTCTSYTVVVDLRTIPDSSYTYTDCNGIVQTVIVTEGNASTTINAIQGSVQPKDRDFTTVTQNAANQSNFNIDQYIGDPRDVTNSEYSGLRNIATTLLNGSLGNSSHYDLQDYVRLIKFFDNTVFKMVKDFIPARAVADTGIIIKPNLLNRSKAKSVIAQGLTPYYTGSIDTAFIQGNDGGTFGALQNYNTAYTETVQTPFGFGTIGQHTSQQAKYDGQLSGSTIQASNGNLTKNNVYTKLSFNESVDNLQYISASTATCRLSISSDNLLVYDTTTKQSTDLFTGVQSSGMTYLLTPTNPSGTPFSINFPYTFLESNFNQYDTFTITATDTNIVSPTCTTTVNLMYGKCSIKAKVVNIEYLPTVVLTDPTTPPPINLLSTYFTIGSQHALANLQVTLYKNNDTTNIITGAQAQTFNWQQYGFDNTDTLLISVKDTALIYGQTCTDYVSITVVSCGMKPLLNLSNEWAQNPSNGIQTGRIGKYQLAPYQGSEGTYPDTQLLGMNSYDATTSTNATTPYNPNSLSLGICPIHWKDFTYPDGNSYDMTEKFPYFTNPNYIFENANETSRNSLPILSTTSGTPSTLSGRQLGLASFFKGLGNLADIFYEVYVHTSNGISNIGTQPILFAASDVGFDPDNPEYPNIGSDQNYDPGYSTDEYTMPGGRIISTTKAIRPGQDSVDGYTNPDTGIFTQYWTYTDLAPNEGSNQLSGYIAKLNLQPLIDQFYFGVQFYPNPSQKRYYVSLWAYTPSSSSPEGYACRAFVNIEIDPWIQQLSSNGNPSGGNG